MRELIRQRHGYDRAYRTKWFCVSVVRALPRIVVDDFEHDCGMRARCCGISQKPFEVNAACRHHPKNLDWFAIAVSHRDGSGFTESDVDRFGTCSERNAGEFNRLAPSGFRRADSEARRKIARRCRRVQNRVEIAFQKEASPERSEDRGLDVN